MSKLRPEWVSRYPLKQKTNLLELAQKASARGGFDSCADFLVKTISGEQKKYTPKKHLRYRDDWAEGWTDQSASDEIRSEWLFG